MKFSENWLREWVNPDLDTDALCEQLTMAGLEVDSVTPAAPPLDSIVVGRVLDVAPHPDADSLRVCSVDAGADSPLSIVCGAPNVARDLCVPVALVGAKMPGPDGMQIAETTIRGVSSHGMLCSAAELGLAESHDGLLTLNASAEPGTPLAQYLELPDNVIEIELTPNRGDCLSIRGVAREVGVGARLAVSGPDCPACEVTAKSAREIVIEDENTCPIYAGRIVTGLDVDARTPDWMRERLRRAGLRPISVLVDVTNYVMLELGQPMHAFDNDKLQGAIGVRKAKSGERIVLLDEADVELDSDTLVIADENGPVAMAGVMGGGSSAVQAGTNSVFLESACFAPSAVAGTGRRYKRHTDALHRYERGVDPALPPLALERATALIIEIAGGQSGPVTLAGAAKPAAKTAITLRHDRLGRLLGTDIAADEVTDILKRLDFQVMPGDGSWQVTPPSFRFDVALEADLIEEIARIHGYNNLPAQTAAVRADIVPQAEKRLPRQRLREVLLQRGYSEAVTYSFVDPVLQERLNPNPAAVPVDNPISEQYAHMRTTLWSSLLPVWQHNSRRQAGRIRLFEFGLRFERDENSDHGIAQIATCAAVLGGARHQEHWDTKQGALDFFDAKGDLEALFAACGRDQQVVFEAAEHSALHPGRSARVFSDGTPIGWLGQLHPKLKNTLGNKELPYVFEVNYEALSEASLPRYHPLSDFPSIRRDIALVLPESIAAGDLVAAIHALKAEFLQSVKVFDVFTGQDLEQGCKSVALGLIFQDKSSTLTDTGVDDVVNGLTTHLGERFGAKVRGQENSGTNKS